MAELETITFHWSRKYGDCQDCGLPAALLTPEDGARRYCSVCAAYHAAAGQKIEWIENPYDEEA